MDWIRSKAGIVSTALLAVLNALAGLGVVLPTGADAEGVALLNSAALAVGALVVHLLGKDRATPVAPVAPVAPADPGAPTV